MDANDEHMNAIRKAIRDMLGDQEVPQNEKIENLHKLIEELQRLCATIPGCRDIVDRGISSLPGTR